MIPMKNEYELKIKGGDGGLFPDVYITSDLHYNHKNICAGTSKWKSGTRPYALLEDMNEAIISGINNTVGQDDILIIAGDVAFQGAESVVRLLERIICRNLYLVFGNHDNEILDNELDLRDYFIACTPYMKLSIGGHHRFIISHYPIVSWHGMNKGWMHLFGHVHLPPSKRFGPGKCMDIGFDGSPQGRPYHLIKECVPLLDKRPIKSWFSGEHVDHHVAEVRVKK